MPDKNLVFIHGFRSSADVWEKLIQLIRDDPDLGGVRIFTFSYPSSIKPQLPQSTTRVPDNSDIAQMLESYLAVNAPRGDIAFVTHSQGGLILQRFLARMLNAGRGRELERIRLIVMLACPNLGSDYLGPFRTAVGFRRRPQARDLHPFNIGVAEAHRTVLNSIDKAQGVGTHECKIPIYAYAGGEDNIVTPASAQSTFTHFGELPGGHSSILDPDAPDNITFRTLKTRIEEHFLASAETERVPAGQESSASIIRVRLDLTLTGEGIRSVLVREGWPDDRVLLPVPSGTVVQEYHKALMETAALTSSPDEATAGRIRALVLPLQRALLAAVPESARPRLAAESAGHTSGLVAIELRLMNSELEAYPWELIADAADVVVWRKVSSPGPPERWTSRLLLAGAADIREVRDELAGISSDLSGCRHLEVVDRAGHPPDLSQLLRQYRPAAFHLVAYPASQPGIQLPSLAADLGRSGVWTAVFNCPDSATASAPQSRPPAGEIATRSGAVTIGMAGQLNPVAGQLFAITFYRWLAQGFSVLQAYHHAVRGIRDHGIYSAMWSIPVMYASSPNVIPFPVSPEAQARLGMDQIRLHVTALDRELQRLARGNYRSAGEWVRQAAIPIVRTQCIVRYLDAAPASPPAANEQERRHQERLDRTREDFRSVLCATEASLRRLASAVGPSARGKELAELPRRRRRHLGLLDDLVREAR